MTTGEFIGGLLHAVTQAHILHLQAKGPGSYARHMALGDFYEALGGAVDDVAEFYQGAYGPIEDYPATFQAPEPDALKWAHGLSRMVQNGRKDLEQDSELQNAIDEVQALIDRLLYKLTNLE